MLIQVSCLLLFDSVHKIEVLLSYHVATIANLL